jgi:hypothetical protein
MYHEKKGRQNFCFVSSCLTDFRFQIPLAGTLPIQSGELRHKRSRPWPEAPRLMGPHTRRACNLSNIRGWRTPSTFSMTQKRVFSSLSSFILINNKASNTSTPTKCSVPWRPALNTGLGPCKQYSFSLEAYILHAALVYVDFLAASVHSAARTGLHSGTSHWISCTAYLWN